MFDFSTFEFISKRKANFEFLDSHFGQFSAYPSGHEAAAPAHGVSWESPVHQVSVQVTGSWAVWGLVVPLFSVSESNPSFCCSLWFQCKLREQFQ